MLEMIRKFKFSIHDKFLIMNVDAEIYQFKQKNYYEKVRLLKTGTAFYKLPIRRIFAFSQINLVEP